ncbi:amidase [Aurantiacibacter flavus]|uniref:Amidase n=1 Tax=Aurantiacibacter flavus TaxID=3145232 RepID=A0ABV0CV24_9SPHN
MISKENEQPIYYQTATDLLERLGSGAISSVELTEQFIARIEALNPVINAVVVQTFDDARTEACAADAARHEGRPLGALHGLPMTIKESFGLAGTPTTFGIPDFAQNIAAADSEAVARLRAAGAIILGKTNVPPALMDGQSVNPIYGRTVNPWDIERTPGGSSGGSAAALATGFSALDYGSDIASSIRNPAHYCGLYGHKPSFGVSPSRGHTLAEHDLTPDIGVTGPLARSAFDLELALSVVAGPEDPMSTAYRLELPAPRRARLEDYRVALVSNDEFAEVDREVGSQIEALGDFLEKEGVHVSRKARPAFDSRELHALYLVLLRAATADTVSDEEFAAAQSAAGGAGLYAQDMATLNAYGVSLSHRDWLRLHAERERLRRAWREFFADHDLMLCPPLSTAAFPHSDVAPQARTLQVNGRDLPFENQLFWAAYAGLPYLPATVAPIGLTQSGLPVGVQIIGADFRDLECIHFAQLLETRYRSFVAPPRFP